MRRRGEEQATDIKSNNPHLAGGELAMACHGHGVSWMLRGIFEDLCVFPPAKVSRFLPGCNSLLPSLTHSLPRDPNILGGFLKWEYPKMDGSLRNIMEHPIKMNDLGVPTGYRKPPYRQLRMPWGTPGSEHISERMPDGLVERNIYRKHRNIVHPDLRVSC